MKFTRSTKHLRKFGGHNPQKRFDKNHNNEEDEYKSVNYVSKFVRSEVAQMTLNLLIFTCTLLVCLNPKKCQLIAEALKIGKSDRESRLYINAFKTGN